MILSRRRGGHAFGHALGPLAQRHALLGDGHVETTLVLLAAPTRDQAFGLELLE